MPLSQSDDPSFSTLAALEIRKYRTLSHSLVMSGLLVLSLCVLVGVDILKNPPAPGLHLHGLNIPLKSYFIILGAGIYGYFVCHRVFIVWDSHREASDPVEHLKKSIRIWKMGGYLQWVAMGAIGLLIVQTTLVDQGH